MYIVFHSTESSIDDDSDWYSIIRNRYKREYLHASSLAFESNDSTEDPQKALADHLVGMDICPLMYHLNLQPRLNDEFVK